MDLLSNSKVTLRKANGQVQVVQVSDQFSLNNPSNPRKPDTVQRRLADIEHDVNGPQPTMHKMRDCISTIGVISNQPLPADFINSLQTA